MSRRYTCVSQAHAPTDKRYTLAEFYQSVISTHGAPPELQEVSSPRGPEWHDAAGPVLLPLPYCPATVCKDCGGYLVAERHRVYDDSGLVSETISSACARCPS